MEKDYKKLKKKAIELRKQGLSYKEIKEKIGTPKSTLSYWLKNIELKPKHKKRLYTKQIEILSRGSQSQKERRKREINKIIKQSKNDIDTPLSSQAFKLMGAAIYWGEGSKTKGLSVTNSDPHLILFMVKWFEEMFGSSPDTLRAKLNIYEQQDEYEIKTFWSDLTGIPESNFNKSYIKPPNKGYKKNNLYYGTIRITVPKGTDFRHKTFGWIKGALQDISSKVQSTQRKWKSLRDVKRPPANLD